MPLVILVALALGILRIAGVLNPSFQAVAHLFLGGVVVAAYYDKLNRWSLSRVAIVLSVVEVLCALFLAR